MFCNFSASHNQPPSSLKNNNQSGFGLVELLVSISIMVLIMAVMLINQTSFNSAILLRGQAYEVALTVREVQMSAVSSSNEADINTFRSILGVHFSTTDNGIYTIFRDADGHGFYNSGEEYGLQGFLDGRFEIRDIQVFGGTDLVNGELSVIFERPNFDARFTVDNTGMPIDATSVQIEIARKGVTGAGSGVSRMVEITSTGQIAVQ